MARAGTADPKTRRLDQLAPGPWALSPQCGFDGLDHLVTPEDDMWRKLERILKTARAAWGLKCQIRTVIGSSRSDCSSTSPTIIVRS
jgi:hypothetical protein